jgi:hypothetical protein
VARPRQTQARGDLPRDELAAAAEARVELGQTHEAEVIDAFLERVEHDIDARVDARLAERGVGRRVPARRGGADWAAAILGIASLGIGIGATGAAAGNDASWIAPFAWLAVVLVNWLYYQYRGR